MYTETGLGSEFGDSNLSRNLLKELLSNLLKELIAYLKELLSYLKELLSGWYSREGSNMENEQIEGIVVVVVFDNSIFFPIISR